MKVEKLNSDEEEELIVDDRGPGGDTSADELMVEIRDRFAIGWFAELCEDEYISYLEVFGVKFKCRE